MFSAFNLCFTAIFAALIAAAVEIAAPSMATSGGDITIKWTLDQALPVFSIELFHTGFNNAIAVANNVNSEAGMIKIQLPSVPPAEDYFFQFVNITNISQVYGTSSNFSIAAPASTSESSTMSNIMTATSDMETMGTSGATATMPASSGASGSRASGSGSAKGSAASATASSAATRAVFHGSSSAAGMGFVLCGLLAGARML